MSNNFVTLHILHDPKTNLYRLDDKQHHVGYEWVDTCYVINSLNYPPSMNATRDFIIVNREEPPYHTIAIEHDIEIPTTSLNQLLTRTISQQDRAYKIIKFSAYVNQVPGSLPLIYKNSVTPNGDQYLDIYKQNPNTNTPYYNHLPISYFFYHHEPWYYWECGGDCICYPSSNSQAFKTAQACQVHCFPQVQQRQVFVRNSNNMLYRILKNYNDQTGGKNFLSEPLPYFSETL